MSNTNQKISFVFLCDGPCNLSSWLGLELGLGLGIGLCDGPSNLLSRLGLELGLGLGLGLGGDR
jgi:hypothetical protein